MILPGGCPNPPFFRLTGTTHLENAQNDMINESFTPFSSGLYLAMRK
jgi:hypothetical protein